MRRWVTRPEGSNWGDFGDDDQIGRMNLVTPAVRLGGVAEVREGISFTLSLPLDFPGGPTVIGRQPPRLFCVEVEETPTFNFPWGKISPGSCDLMCDDGVVMSTQYSTQWDSLAHWGKAFDADGDGVDEPVYYNGYRVGEHLKTPARGQAPYAGALGIENLAMAGVQGRGVLVNLATIYGATGEAVGYEGLMRAIEPQRVDLKPGDFLLVHTGYDDLLLGMDRRPDHDLLRRSAVALDGSDRRLLDWITESQIVAICTDKPSPEVTRAVGDPHLDPKSFLPLHEHCLFKLGVHLGEMWRTGELARWLAAAGRSAFLLTAPPLRLPGSVGSPVTPIATV